VQLPVAVEDYEARIIRDEIEFNFLKTAEHHDILDVPCIFAKYTPRISVMLEKSCKSH
jgi:hypothetical protein